MARREFGASLCAPAGRSIFQTISEEQQRDGAVEFTIIEIFICPLNRSLSRRDKMGLNELPASRCSAANNNICKVSSSAKTVSQSLLG